REATPELWAPYRGTLQAIRQDLGGVPELYTLPSKTPSGSALIELEAVRERFDDTMVLGQKVPYTHPKIRAFLDFFDGRGKRTLVKWLTRMARYEPMIQQTLKEEGLPEDLIFVAMIESGFSPYATSPAKAVGLWQFIEVTGADMGLRIDRYVDERRDPVKSTRAAARYLKHLYEKYDSWPLALAAYNGGAGRVSGEMRRLNTNSYWALVRHQGMHEEARRYVSKIMTAALIHKNADLFGLGGLGTKEALEYDVVEVEKQTRLDRIARAIGCGVDDIMELNPELMRAMTPPQKKPYALRLPRGKAKRYVEKLDKIEVDEEVFTHTVAFGENIDLIAKKYAAAPRVLRAANGLGSRERLTYGSALVIPSEAVGKWTPTDKEKPFVLVPKAPVVPPETTRYFYETNPGDSLQVIGQAFKVNPADVALWNELDLTANLGRGLTLQLYLPGDAPNTLALRSPSDFQVIVAGSDDYKKKMSRASKRKVHRVRPGESLWLIARKHKTTVKKLKQLNRELRRNQALQPGTVIVIRR
ncbi:MAG: transglycosylase SLT domain-containing protein, partial [Myxococcota bacterium]